MKETHVTIPDTFLIKVYSGQGNTLHGRILYANDNKALCFKNTGEMLKLIAHFMAETKGQNSEFWTNEVG